MCKNVKEPLDQAGDRSRWRVDQRDALDRSGRGSYTTAATVWGNGCRRNPVPASSRSVGSDLPAEVVLLRVGAGQAPGPGGTTCCAPVPARVWSSVSALERVDEVRLLNRKRPLRPGALKRSLHESRGENLAILDAERAAEDAPTIARRDRRTQTAERSCCSRSRTERSVRPLTSARARDRLVAETEV